ncbi:TetR family transcriptional regulator [Propioniferax innocua]|uniref:TetR family transcriptional regulator n=1 Tax=Propioniferax innocua TaxID=1753 RepID=A0A542ZBW1_9ACTN|nr:TetR family transcriptional regulator [Propioniferax innocua]
MHSSCPHAFGRAGVNAVNNGSGREGSRQHPRTAPAPAQLHLDSLTVTTGYHHGRLRDEMIRIGLELAAEGGSDAVGIREITRRAGVSPAAAYRHFRDQQELREKVAREIDRMLSRDLEAAVSSTHGTARDKLLAAGNAYFDFAFANPQLFAHLNNGFSPAQDGSVFDAFVEVVHALGVEQLGHAPALERSRELSVALWSAGHGFCVLVTTGALKDLDDETKYHLREVTITNVVNGLDFT